MPESTVVTGAAGHLGYNLVRQLIDEGKRPKLILFTHTVPDHISRLGDKVTVRLCEPGNESELKKAFAGCHHVYHTGTSGQVGSYRDVVMPAEEIPANTTALLNAAAAAGIERVVFLSSFAAGVDVGDGNLLDLFHLSEKLQLPYMKSKAEAEKTAREIASGLDTEICFVLASGIIGPHDYILTPPNRFILDLLQGRMRVIPRGGINPVDVRDVATGLRLIMKNGDPSEHYILAGDLNLYFREVVNFLAEIRDIHIPETVLTKEKASRLARISEWFGRMLEQPPLFSRELASDIFETYAWFDNSLAKSRLNWKPRSFKETLADTVLFLEGHY